MTEMTSRGLPMRRLITTLLWLCWPLLAAGQDFDFSFPQLGGEREKPREKIAVPAAAARDEAKKLIDSIYADAIGNARTDAKKRDLAMKLMEAGKQSGSDPAAQFELFVAANSYAVDSLALDMAVEAIRELDNRFKFDALKLEARTLHKVSQKLKTPNDLRVIVPRFSALLRRCVLSDRFDLAVPLADIAYRAAQKSTDAKLTRAVREGKQQIEVFAEQFKAVQQFSQTLETNPVDPEANQQVGSFRCFVKNDWESGLPMLALGNDAKFKELAILELKEPSSADDLVTLGDGWWEIAQTRDGVAKQNTTEHARHWLQRAHSQLSGLQKLRIEKLFEEMGPAVGNSSTQPANGMTLRDTLILQTWMRNYWQEAKKKGTDPSRKVVDARFVFHPDGKCNKVNRRRSNWKLWKFEGEKLILTDGGKYLAELRYQNSPPRFSGYDVHGTYLELDTPQ